MGQARGKHLTVQNSVVSSAELEGSSVGFLVLYLPSFVESNGIFWFPPSVEILSIENSDSRRQLWQSVLPLAADRDCIHPRKLGLYSMGNPPPPIHICAHTGYRREVSILELASASDVLLVIQSRDRSHPPPLIKIILFILSNFLQVGGEGRMVYKDLRCKHLS